MRRRGFTLIEIMVAVSVLAMVSTLVYGSFRGTFKTKAAIEAQAGRYRTVRIALERLSREVSQAFLSQNEDTGQAERRTLFVGQHKSDVDELRFSYFGHQRLYQDADEADTAQVVYYGARSREDSRRMNLVRRETRRLGHVRAENAPGEVDILCDDVVRLKLEYWDSRDKQWREDWKTTTADGQPDRLPGRVKITLTVRDERGKDVPFSTEARIAIQEPLNLRAVDRQSFVNPNDPNAKKGACGAPGQACCTTSGQPPCQGMLKCVSGKCT
jgi:general secretion pathway protein J